MSKFVSVKLAFKDKDVLKATLKELGYGEIEEYEEAQQLCGYEGSLREDKANIIIRRQHIGRVSNDLGFVKTANGYDMVISEYDRSAHGKVFLEQLPQQYGVNKTRKTLKHMGCTVTSQKTNAKGQIKIRAMIP